MKMFVKMYLVGEVGECSPVGTDGWEIDWNEWKGDCLCLVCVCFGWVWRLGNDCLCVEKEFVFVVRKKKTA